MLLDKEKIKCFLNENKWVIAALVFFIVWKFIFIAVLWNDRLSPPEPDDSYTYINQIAAVKYCPHILCEYPAASFINSGGFIYLSYRVFLGIISKLLFLTPTQTYHLGFYIGTVLISLVFLFFLKKITVQKKAIAFLLFFLTFYHGTGETHGFYWVVPDFYSVLLFFLILAIILAPKKHPLLLLILTPIFIFAHPLSIYFSFIFPLFYMLFAVFEKKNDFVLLKKIAFVLLIALFCHASESFYLRGGDNYFSLGAQIKQLKYLHAKFFSGNTTVTAPTEATTDGNESGTNYKSDEKLPDKKSFINKKMDLLSATYFTWFFPVWIGFFPFIFFIIILFYYRQHVILSLYFSSLLLFLVSTFSSEFGFRSGTILWIASFLLYGSGFFYSFRFIKSTIRKKYLLLAVQIILSFGLFMFIFLNSVFSLIFASNLNIRSNYDIRPGFSDYIIANTQKGDPINVTPILFYCNTTSALFSHNQLTQDIRLSKYAVLLKENDDEKKIINSKMYIFLKKIMNFLRIQKGERIQKETRTPKNFHEEKKIGSVIIYKNNLWNQQ